MKLLPDAMAGAAAFALCRTQWAYAPSGRPTGLRYEGCMTALTLHCERLGIDAADLPQVFADLQAMETAFVRGVGEVMAASEEQDRGPVMQGGGWRGHS